MGLTVGGWDTRHNQTIVLAHSDGLGPTERRLLQRLHDNGWTVILSRGTHGSDVSVTLSRDPRDDAPRQGETLVLRDATTRQALQTAWDTVRDPRPAPIGG